jgi:hypothetical protein
MTVREDLERRLKDIGMNDIQAKGCVDLYVEEWGHETKIPLNGLAYEDALQRLFFMVLKPYALKYIEQTCPGAWFKPMLLPEEELNKFIEDTKKNNNE